MPRSFPQAKVRVGLREVAAAAKVCVMTVSLALRDNPRISGPTRDRVKRLAEELGYHPDPELSRLMNHLRVSRTARGRIGVAIVDFYPTADHAENPYNSGVRLAATQRASELGISITTIHGADYQLNLAKILKVIRTRGIEGALLLPSIAPLELDATVDWNGISVVGTSKSLLAPRFHCVVPNQFDNTMRMTDALQAHGHRRICAVFDALFDERTGRNFTAAFNWQPRDRATLVVPQDLSTAKKIDLVVDWLSEQRPDAVFAQCAQVGAAIPRLRKVRPRLNFQMVGLGAHNSAGFSYIDERSDRIGASAMDLLGGMMYYHETGVPAHPRTTLIDGKLMLKRKVVGDVPALVDRVGSA